MCGYVAKMTNMTDLNQILAAIEQSVPGLTPGCLGRLKNGKPTDAMMTINLALAALVAIKGELEAKKP